VTMLRTAATVGTRLVDAIVAAAQPGITEGAAIGAGMTEAACTPGCIHWNFLVASGPDAKYFVRRQTPAWNPTYVYQAGDVLHIDCYGYVYGYQYDLTRTVVVGAPPTEGQRRVIEASRALPGQMAALLTPGVTARSLWQAARDVVAQGGFVADQIWFGHSIGFGWGPPYLDTPGARPDSDWVLSPPCAFAFENFLDDQHGNCACWEDVFIWLAEGVEQITGRSRSDSLGASRPGPAGDAGIR
jgi:Xaa-Pro aminopeptidase